MIRSIGEGGKRGALESVVRRQRLRGHREESGTEKLEKGT